MLAHRIQRATSHRELKQKENNDHSIKKALVIGGNSGAGRDIILSLAELGVDTRVVARDLAKLKSYKQRNIEI